MRNLARIGKIGFRGRAHTRVEILSRDGSFRGLAVRGRPETEPLAVRESGALVFKTIQTWEVKEMRRKSLVLASLFLTCCLLTGAVGLGSALAVSADKPVVWKVQTPWPPALWQHKAAQIWAQDIEKLSGGRMKIDLYATDEIVPAFEIYDSVRVGTLDAGHTWSGYVIGKFPAATMFAATPAFFDLLGYWTWMNAGGGKELWQEMYGDTVVVFPSGMLWAEGGGWANKKIEKLADFKGLKYRTVLIWGQILSEVGASVVTLPAGDIVPSLQRGTLDAAEFSTPITDFPLGFHEVAKYYYAPGLHQISGFLELMINPEKMAGASRRSERDREGGRRHGAGPGAARLADGRLPRHREIQGLRDPDYQVPQGDAAGDPGEVRREIQRPEGPDVPEGLAVPEGTS